MAQKISVELVDDLDGGTADETVAFGLDGVQYEVDLSDKNAAALREALDAWVAAGRRVGGRRARTATKVEAGVDNAAVRAWAADNEIPISSRGRIPADIIEQYHSAGN